MLAELHVRNLGVIDELTLLLDGGLTALTGETGAGKTLVVEAIELLVGAKADPLLVRPGEDEATVDGRFVSGDDEVVLSRVVPRAGRSRAYVDGRVAPLAALAERGAALVDLYGQHAHQSLLSPAVQRAALDAFGGVDLAPLAAARRRVAGLDADLAALGGDQRARAREIDLLRFQVGELDAAGLGDPGEDAALEAEEDRLAGAAAHREAAAAAHAALADDGGAGDAVAAAVAAVAGRAPFAEIEARLRAVTAEVAEAALDVRAAGEAIADDPERLEAVRARRRLLRELCRKYGDSLADVIAFAGGAADRLAELESYDARAAGIERERVAACDAVAAAAAAVGAARRAAAPALAEAVGARLRELAMPHGRVQVTVGDDDPGDDVEVLLAPNPGEPALPLARAASGGELARTMLALRLVLAGAGSGGDPGELPSTLVFDEVDAGIGGEAAVAVGRALAGLAAGRQVLVVTHLPQVAAFADHQVAITKDEDGGRTLARARRLDEPDRVVELSRMLSGRPGSATARVHAEELLSTAAATRKGRRRTR